MTESSNVQGASGSDPAMSEAASDVSLIAEASEPPPETELEEKAVPELLLDNRDAMPDKVAIRQKRLGVWEEFDWAEYYRRVEAFALGLETLGFEEDDVLFTIGYNRPHQLWAWVAAQALGGKAAPFYEGTLADDIQTQLDLMEPAIAYAEDQELVDRLLSIGDDAPYLDCITYRDEKGMFRYEESDPEVVPYQAIETRGFERREDLSENYLRDRIRSLDPSKPAMLPPTSGTTGVPKRVKISHNNYLHLAHSWQTIEDLPPDTDYFSFLPMAWGGEQMILLARALVDGWTANFAEQPETEDADFREIGPDFVVSSYSWYEDLAADIKARIENTTWLKRQVYDVAMSIGYRLTEYINGERHDQTPPRWLRAANWLAYWAVYRQVLDKSGLKRAKVAYTGGGPLGAEHFEFFHALGVPLKQAWGQTETCGFVTIHRDRASVETVGKPIPGVTVGLTHDQELVVKGPIVSDGYYNQPEKTAETIKDGWLHTDDYGSIASDGEVTILDRMDNVLELADGTEVTPISLETNIKFNPYIDEAWVIGDSRAHLAAVLSIRYENVAEWADQHDIQYTGYADLSQQPEVIDLLTEILREVNDDFETGIRRYTSLFKEFDPDDGEVTRTGKLRRAPLLDRYEDLVEALYSDKDTVDLEVSITYQDGTETVEQATMEIVTVQDDPDRADQIVAGEPGGDGDG
jgi:long-chain acyl-CoA synthetase